MTSNALIYLFIKRLRQFKLFKSFQLNKFMCLNKFYKIVVQIICIYYVYIYYIKTPFTIGFKSSLYISVWKFIDSLLYFEMVKKVIVFSSICFIDLKAHVQLIIINVNYTYYSKRFLHKFHAIQSPLPHYFPNT